MTNQVLMIASASPLDLPPQAVNVLSESEIRFRYYLPQSLRSGYECKHALGRRIKHYSHYSNSYNTLFLNMQAMTFRDLNKPWPFALPTRQRWQLSVVASDEPNGTEKCQYERSEQTQEHRCWWKAVCSIEVQQSSEHSRFHMKWFLIVDTWICLFKGRIHRSTKLRNAWEKQRRCCQCCSSGTLYVQGHDVPSAQYEEG